jgi:outer membrane protein assembly factor BamB
MRRRSRALVALAFVLSCLVGCLPVVAAKPAKAKPVAAAKPKPKPATSGQPSPTIPASAPGDWTTYGADFAATGDNPDESSITAANVASLHEVWHVPGAGASPTTPTPPLVAGGLVFDTAVSGGNIPNDFTTTVSAYDLESGGVRWQRALSGELQVVGAAYGLVLVATQDFRFGTKVQALDQQTGAPRWSWDQPNGGQIDGAAFAASGHIFVPIAGGLWAFDPFTGHQLFVITCTDEDGVNCPFNQLNGQSASGGLVYIGGSSKTAGFEFSAVDGHRINGLAVPYTQGGFTTPLISGSQVFVRGEYMGSDGHIVGEVASFSTAPCGAEFCTPQWEVEVPGGAGYLALADGRLFVNGGNVLEALNPASGQPLWRIDLPQDYGPGEVLVAGNVVYVATMDILRAFPAAGCGPSMQCAPLWRDSTGDDLYPMTPVISGGRLLYTDSKGLHALGVN